MSLTIFYFRSLVFCLFCASLQAMELSGSLQQGGLVIGQAELNSQVLVDGDPVMVSPKGLFVIGFDRDAKPSVEVTVINERGERNQQTFSVAPREYNLQRIEGISKKIMNPNEADLKRIRADSQAVKTARAQRLERVSFSDAFKWPVIGPISGVFGSQRVYNGVPKRPHYGVDVAVPTGTPVSTPAPGVVTLSHADMFYSGGTLIIDHGHGVSSTLMHLSKVLVDEGQVVKPGDIVGLVGATGRVTGPHLDWRMNWQKARIDPQLLVPPMPQQ